MPVEFLGIAATDHGSGTASRSGAAYDKECTLRLARAHEDHGWDRVLSAHGSGSPDPAPTAAAGGAGDSHALVGAPGTVARALLDHHDLGVDIPSARDHDLLGDAIDFGRYVIPIVREGVAERDAARAARGPRSLAAMGE
ncbi:hypothetical protein ACWG5P_11870 [Streptomyces prasinus]